MPFKHGKDTAVLFNGTSLSPYLNSADLDISVDTADTSAFGSGWKSAIAGQAAVTFSCAGMYDVDQAALIGALTVDSGVLTFCPGGGATIGDRARLVAVTGTSYAESAPVGDVVGMSWEAQGETAVAFGDVLHPLGEDTNTTTGASRDDTAATSTGWTAHLHVTLVDGGTWVVKLQDSADNSSWADLSGGAFGSVSGAGGARLTSSAGATLRRYVRYVATRTGGSAGDGITFHLSYARI